MLQDIKKALHTLLSPESPVYQTYDMPNAAKKVIAKQLPLILGARRSAAVYQHLQLIRECRHIPDDLQKEIEQLANPLKVKILHQQAFKDDFDNPVDAALFETQLAYAILKTADLTVLNTINKKIIAYLERMKSSIYDLDYLIRGALNKFHIPFDEAKRPIDVLIELLQRDPTCTSERERIQILCETFTLHLLVFNYKHIYNPALEMLDEEAVTAHENKRKDIHAYVRPAQEGEMFHKTMRGRERVESSKRSKAFGICDDAHTPKVLKEVHRVDFTPHKYRAKADTRSQMVRYLKHRGVPLISGPSGTTADCIEGLYFLYPEMTLSEWHSYIMLLAAAETGMGHHSINEVILTASHAGVLNSVGVASIAKPFWAKLNYRETYRALLTDAFKASVAFKELEVNFPDFLATYPIPIEERHIKERKRQQDKLLRHWWMTPRRKEAGARFHGSKFWRGVEKVDAGMVPPPSHSDFMTLRSSANLNMIKSELDVLTPSEERFKRLVMSQEIALTHYTNSLDAILKSGCIMSGRSLSKKGKSYYSNSSMDIEALRNDDYVFFRMEFKHDYAQRSRFGFQQLVFNGRSGQFLRHAWISLFEMYDPTSASVLGRLSYKDSTVRRTGYANAMENISVDYPSTGEEIKLDIADTVFQGPHIMEGLALVMLRELRRIGGEMEEDMLALASKESLEEENYKKTLETLNWLLSRLFRLEAKIPYKVLLSEEKYHVFDMGKVISHIRDDNKLGICRTMRGLALDNCLQIGKMPDDMYEHKLIDLVFLEGKVNLYKWLIQEGQSLSHKTIEKILKQPDQLINHLSKEGLREILELVPELSIETVFYGDKTWIHMAARNNKFDLIPVLFELGCDPYRKDNGGYTYHNYLSFDSFFGLIKSKSVEQITETLALLPGFKMLSMHDITGRTLLWHACQKLHIDLIIYLLRKGGALNTKSMAGTTALETLQKSIIASSHPITVEALERLLVVIPALVIDVSMDEYNKSWIARALNHNKFDVYLYLLKKGKIKEHEGELEKVIKEELIRKGDPDKLLQFWPQLKPYANQSIMNNSVLPLLYALGRRGRLSLLEQLLKDPYFDPTVTSDKGNDYINALYQYCKNKLCRALETAEDRLSAVIKVFEMFPQMQERLAREQSFKSELIQVMSRTDNVELLKKLHSLGLLSVETEEGDNLLFDIIKYASTKQLALLLEHNLIDLILISRDPVKITKIFTEVLAAMVRSKVFEEIDVWLQFSQCYLSSSEIKKEPSFVMILLYLMHYTEAAELRQHFYDAFEINTATQKALHEIFLQAVPDSIRDTEETNLTSEHEPSCVVDSDLVQRFESQGKSFYFKAEETTPIVLVNPVELDDDMADLLRLEKGFM